MLNNQRIDILKFKWISYWLDYVCEQSAVIVYKAVNYVFKFRQLRFVVAIKNQHQILNVQHFSRNIEIENSFVKHWQNGCV